MKSVSLRGVLILVFGVPGFFAFIRGPCESAMSTVPSESLTTPSSGAFSSSNPAGCVWVGLSFSVIGPPVCSAGFFEGVNRFTQRILDLFSAGIHRADETGPFLY